MDILHEAPNLLHRYRQGDAFRHYVHRRRPLVAAALIVFLAFSAVTTAGMVAFFGGTSELRVFACLLLAPFVLLGSLFVQAFVFFSWLERRAIDRVSGRKPCSALQHLSDIPWALAGVFIVVPFFVLALVSLKAAATLLVVAILMPVLVELLDE